MDKIDFSKLDKEFYNNYKSQIEFFWKYAEKLDKTVKYNSTDVVLFRLDLIGDCTMFTSAAKALREFYKDRKMTVVCLNISKPIFEHLNCFDEIITVDFKPDNINYEKLGEVIDVLSRRVFDILLQPQISKLPIVDIIVASLKVNKRITIETKVGNSPEGWVKMVECLYDVSIPYPRKKSSEFDFYATFVRGIVGEDFRLSKPVLGFSEQKFIKDDYYVFFPAGSVKQKFWPPERFAKVADYVCRKTKLKCVILGAKSEKWVSELIYMNVHSSTEPYIIDLCGKTSINDVIDIIGNSKLVVTNDTSGVHIACATNVPSVGIAGGWHFDRFLPYHIEKTEPTDKLPLVAHTNMDCYFCDWYWPTVEKRNPKCLENLKNEDLSICIKKVRTEQVIELVDKILVDIGY